ncbi:MAG: hypothetical protein ACRDKZ_01055 [Actinomycetota bacterium]
MRALLFLDAALRSHTSSESDLYSGWIYTRSARKRERRRVRPARDSRRARSGIRDVFTHGSDAA